MILFQRTRDVTDLPEVSVSVWSMKDKLQIEEVIEGAETRFRETENGHSDLVAAALSIPETIITEEEKASANTAILYRADASPIGVSIKYWLGE